MNEFEKNLLSTLSGVMDLIGRTEDEALEAGAFDNLSRSEMHTLKTIGLYDEKTMGETANLLGVTMGTLTVQIDRLVKKGYVLRHRKNEDRRVVLLRLSKRGKVAFRMHNKFNMLLVQKLMQPLEDDEQKVLYKALVNVEVSLEEQREKYAVRRVKKNEDIKK